MEGAHVISTGTTSRWKLTTKRLWFCCFVFAWGDILFGYDTGMFGGLQALPSFVNDFGQDLGNGKRGFTSQRRSIMNSIVWIGKISGTLSTEPILERIGYTKVMYMVVVFQCLAVIIELTSKSWIQYSIGRIFAYYAVGLAETTVPSYCSELAPVPLRTFFAASINWFLGFGSILGSVLNRVFAEEQTRKGWMVPTAIQLIPALMLAVFVPFTVQSPRWLVAHGRKEEALASLDRFRRKEDVDSGWTVLELEAIEQAIVEARQGQQGRWIDIFRGTYFRRSMIAAFMFIFQQGTGNQFLNLYGPTFYVSMGLGSMSFTYSLVGNAPNLFCGLIALVLYDKIGRRPIMIIGSFLQVIFLIIVAVVGDKTKPTQSEVHGMVASFILFGVCAKIALTQPCYAIGSEVGGTRLRKKIMSWATSVDVLAAFVVSYTCPYLIGTPGLNLGAKVGWIFAVISFGSFVFVTFYVPELKGRSLEEIDELFEMRLWAWQFKNARTTGVGARVTALEGGAATAVPETDKLCKEEAKAAKHIESI